MPHTPTDMSKWWTGSRKLCQKLAISPFQSEISDVPAGCVCYNEDRDFSDLNKTGFPSNVHHLHNNRQKRPNNRQILSSEEFCFCVSLAK